LKQPIFNDGILIGSEGSTILDNSADINHPHWIVSTIELEDEFIGFIEKFSLFNVSNFPVAVRVTSESVFVYVSK